MIKKGKYIGQYSFANQAHNKMRGHDQTTFYIDIISIEDGKFSGQVQDDLLTGGTEGVGEVTGTVTGNNVEFVKQMPIFTFLADKNGTTRTFNKKHRKLYYSGSFSKDFKTIHGQWKFKFEFIWLGIIPYPAMPVTGTWSMTFKD